MVQIELTRGETALVDDIDTDFTKHNWHVSNDGINLFYAKRAIPIGNGKYKNIFMHREIMERMLGRNLEPGEYVDHKDGDGLNNSRSNLRLATNQENAQHRRIRAGPKSSIFKGVYLNKRYGTWQAQIKILGKRKFLGRFDIEEDAGFAYNQAAAIYGEFALLNELEDNYIPTQIHIKRPKSSQYMGVYWNKQSNNWRARIRIDGKDKSLGCFENEEEAARTYDRAALKRDVNCLVLNFPLSNYLISVPEIGAMV